jgi:hypothetical protein
MDALCLVVAGNELGPTIPNRSVEHYDRFGLLSWRLHKNRGYKIGDGLHAAGVRRDW